MSIIGAKMTDAALRRAALRATDALMDEDPRQGLRIEADAGVFWIAHRDGHYVVALEKGPETTGDRFGMDIWAGSLRLSLTAEGEEPRHIDIEPEDVRSIVLGRGDADEWEELEHRVLYDFGEWWRDARWGTNRTPSWGS